MNKPDWKDAPEWAKYLAMDLSGNWNWFEYKPFVNGTFWDGYKGKFAVAKKSTDEWKQSLEERPK